MLHKKKSFSKESLEDSQWLEFMYNTEVVLFSPELKRVYGGPYCMPTDPKEVSRWTENRNLENKPCMA